MNAQRDKVSGRLRVGAKVKALLQTVRLRESAPMALTMVAGQAITFLSLPLLLRIYGPEAFGEFSLVVSITSTLLICATLKLEIVIPNLRYLTKGARLTTALLVWGAAVSLFLAAGGLMLNAATGWSPGYAIPAVLLFAVMGALLFADSSFLLLRNLLVRASAFSGTIPYPTSLLTRAI